MTLTPAIFGIESGPLNTVVQLVMLAVVVIWLSLVWYTLADSRRRVDDQMLAGSAVLASLIFPFLGTIVYMIVRPPEYLEDVRERELEMQAAQSRLVSNEYQLCPHCDAGVGRDFLRCPHCLRKLRDNCGSCAKPLDPDWMICPYCEAEIPGVTPQRRRRRRPGASDADQSAYADDLSSEASQAPPGYGEHGHESYGDPPGPRADDTLVARGPVEGGPDDVAWSDVTGHDPEAPPASQPY